MSKKIQQEASSVLIGAEYLSDRIKSLADIGPNSLHDQVYAVKVRVKTLDSLIAKVKNKRTDPSKAEYSATDSTDIVGVRLLSLYGADLFKVVQSLIGFIGMLQSDQIQLIAGDLLDDAIEEIIVFKSTSNRHGYDTAYRLCQSLPLHEVNQKGNSKLILVEEDGKDSKTYSSIHFICRGLSYANGAPKEIPIEFQVRTVFEDAWSEIEHELRYKLINSTKKKFTRDQEQQLENHSQILDSLKENLETAGKQAEAVRRGYQYITDSLAERGRRNKSEMFRLEYIYCSSPITQIILKAVSDDFEYKAELLAVIENSESIRIRMEAPQIEQRDLRKILNDIESHVLRCDKLVIAMEGKYKSSLDESSISTLNYYLQMDAALSLVWTAKITIFLSPNSVHEYTGSLENARERYIKLEKYRVHRSDAMLNFRLGCVFDSLRDHDMDLHFYEEAMKHAAVDPRIERSIFSFLIPHHLAFSKWQKRAGILDSGLVSGNARMSRKRQLDLVMEAIMFGLYALHMSELYLENTESSRLDQLQTSLRNNLVSYIWEAVDFSHDIDEFVIMMEKVFTHLKNTLPNYVGRALEKIEITEVIDPKSVKYLARADTKMKLCHMLGDVKGINLHKTMVTDYLASVGNGQLDSRRKRRILYSVNQIEKSSRTYTLPKGITF